MKRLFDLLVSSLLFSLLLPVFLIIACLVKKNIGSPVLFRQTRPGLKGKAFDMIKFRTMANTVDAEGQLLSDDERLTAFGRWLRASSLDELPELWNVIRGDMSLVGPRPLLMDYLPLYSPIHSRRHDIKPGITGWAQINGRNALAWEEKFNLDIWYLDNRSFWLDLKILFLTIRLVLLRKEINAQGQATVGRFSGY